MEHQIEPAFEPTLPAEARPELPVERPTGVTWAVVLIVLGSLFGLVVRLAAMPVDTTSAGWIGLHLFSFAVAWGLWRLQRWAYWLLLIAIVVGIGQNLWRLVFTLETFGIVYPVLRLGVLGLWGWYFRRFHVRRAFRMKASPLPATSVGGDL